MNFYKAFGATWPGAEFPPLDVPGAGAGAGAVAGAVAGACSPLGDGRAWTELIANKPGKKHIYL